MGATQYIGARYVPKFYENETGSSSWESGVAYEPLTIVTYNGNSYTSKKPVPSTIGNPSSNPFYWAATGIFNEQLAELSPLKETAIRAFDTVATMLTANLPRNIYVVCQSYYQAGGMPITYFISDTDEGYGIRLSNGLIANPVIDKTSVYVSQFGAVGDGETDDTTAIQNAVNYAGDGGTVIIDRKVCRISGTITINNTQFTLRGNDAPEYIGAIYMPADIATSPAIRVTKHVFTMRGVQIWREITTRTSRTGTAIIIKASSVEEDPYWYNMDAYIEKCYFTGWDLAADCTGRNIIFRDDTHFSNCNIGVWYHSAYGNEEVSQSGWIVENCRFHSAGDGITIADPEQAHSVAVKTDLNARSKEIIIRNNIFDGQSICMMYSGISDGLNIKDNLVEADSYVTFGLIKRGLTNYNHFPVIKGNHINTTGSAEYGIYSDSLIYSSVARLMICDNFVRAPFKAVMSIAARDTGITTSTMHAWLNNIFYTSVSNGKLFTSEDGSTSNLRIIGNLFGVTGGATGISISGDSTIINSNHADCNIIESGYSY